MNDYYFLTGGNTLPGTVAFAVGVDKLSRELIEDLKDATTVPFDLTLKSVREGANGLIYDDDFLGINDIWSDYLPNEFTWLMMMSAKMRQVVENNLSGQESVSWMTCRVKHRKEVMIYNVLRFNKLLDVFRERFVTFEDKVEKDR